MNCISFKISLFLFLIANILLYAENPSVEKVDAVFREGKTYISFKKGDSSSVNYLIYRLTDISIDLNTQTPIATIPENSYFHPDNKIAFTIPNGGTLNSNEGFFVYTPKIKEKVFYCVIPEGNTLEIIAGKNIIDLAIEESPAEKPSAIFQMQKQINNQVEDYYANWMDYDIWQKDNSPGQWPNNSHEYYGSFFSISYLKSDENSTEKLPVIISLHSISGGGNGGYYALTPKKGFYRIFVCDHRKRWWEGKTAARINSQIDFLINNSRYNIDKNRVYLEGVCMGGHGAIYHALQYPEKYASIYAQVPNINPEQLESIKNGKDFPPILSYFGFKDGTNSNYNFGKKGHTPFLKTMQENKFGVWANWLDEGHNVPKDMTPEKSLAGGYIRFKKNEVVPIFINTSTDENCGQKGEINISTSGQVNQKIDWSSSLHMLDLPDSAIIDNPEELTVTFKSLSDCTTDLSFRRIQNFRCEPGKKVEYKNIDVASGKILQSGELTIPLEKWWVIKGIQMLGTGNRVSIRSAPQ